MSPLPIEPSASAPRAGVSRLLRRGRGPSATLFVQPQCAWAVTPDGGAARRFDSAIDAVQAHAGGSLRLVLSGLLTREMIVTDPIIPLADAGAVAEWARHQFEHYHGAAARAWSLAPWHDGAQRGAAALHGLDLPALDQAALRHDVRLRAVQPWWAVALHALTREAPTLALAERAELWLVEGVHVTRVLCAGGTVRGIEQHWLDRADGAALAGLWTSRPAPAPACWVVGYGLAAETAPPAGLRCPASLVGDRPSARWLEA